MNWQFGCGARAFLCAVTAFVLTIGCQSLDSGANDGGATTVDTPHISAIVGGQPFDGLPAVGALTFDGEPFCTGTLIDSRRVLTAAHCLEDGGHTRMRFAIGPSAWDPEAVVAVASAEMHPYYDPEEITNDLGLVHLAQDAPVEPLGLLESMDRSWVGEEMLFVGYGMDRPYREAGLGVKRIVIMPIERVTDFDFSFGGPDANICDGDSGSPVLYRQPNGEVLVAGVVSNGDDWCREFGIATRVDAYLDFISGESDDPCGGETFYGRCEGNTLVWCEGDRVYTHDCDELEAHCELYGDEGYYCVE